MKQTKIIMGMPITVEIIGDVEEEDVKGVFDYFRKIDRRFSTYKSNSEISKINNGLAKEKWSDEMTLVLDLCEQTKRLTHGYFDIRHNGKLDPSGLVKGWAINNASQLLLDRGIHNFYIEAGGDIQACGSNDNGEPWVVGIRNPFNIEQIIKVVNLTNEGMATSGMYVRGPHIYNPLENKPASDTIKSLTVIGPNVYEADRYATAAFAMGSKGIGFIEETPDLEGYVVDANATATYTVGFERRVVQNA